MLYLIGLGLNDEKDITLKGLEAIKKCKKIYLDTYTSKLNCSIKKLEKLYKKKINLADRKLIEESNTILKEAKKQNIALLIPGTPLVATTHINLILEAKKQKIKTEVIENASIYTAIAITGLFIYKFGQTTTTPFDNVDIKSPYEVYLKNQKNNFHTLFLLDIKNNKLMTINEALAYLLKQGLDKNKLVIGCTALGSKKPEIKVGLAYKILNYKFKKFPQCLIIPSTLHFIEEESIKNFK